MVLLPPPVVQVPPACHELQCPDRWDQALTHLLNDSEEGKPDSSVTLVECCCCGRLHFSSHPSFGSGCQQLSPSLRSETKLVHPEICTQLSAFGRKRAPSCVCPHFAFAHSVPEVQRCLAGTCWASMRPTTAGPFLLSHHNTYFPPSRSDRHFFWTHFWKLL